MYWTRLQKERIKNPDSIDISNFTITADKVGLLPKNSIILHPLPRVKEISAEVDKDPRAKYFEQAGNGLYIRMAILDSIASN